MRLKFKSIQSQILTLSISIIIITLVAVIGITSYQVTSQAKEDYYNNSSEQLKIVEESIIASILNWIKI